MIDLDLASWLWLAGTAVLLLFFLTCLWAAVAGNKPPITPVVECPFCVWETIREISTIKVEMKKMTAAMQALTDQVKKNTDLESSVSLLVKGLADQIAAAKDDPAQVLVLTDQLKASADVLGAAVVASTPAAPVP